MDNIKERVDDFHALCHRYGFSSEEINCIMSVISTLALGPNADYNNHDFIEKCNKTYQYIRGKEIAREFMAILKYKGKWGTFMRLSSNYMLISTQNS